MTRYDMPSKISAGRPENDKEDVLPAAVKFIKDSIGPDALVPILLVYGTIPRLGLLTNQTAAGRFVGGRAVTDAWKAVSKYFAQRLVQDVLQKRDEPDVSDLYEVRFNTHVLVYRSLRDRWDGAFSLLI